MSQPSEKKVSVDLFEDLNTVKEKYGGVFDKMRKAVGLTPTQHFGSDVELYRYLRAWEFDADAATKALGETLVWYKEQNLGEAFEKSKGKPQKEWPYCAQFLQIYPLVAIHGIDLLNQPLGIVRVGPARPDLVNKLLSWDKMLEFQKWNMTNRWLEINRMSEEQGKVIRMCRVIDLQGLGAHHLNPTAMKYFREILTAGQAYFPEVMGKIIIVNSPWLFNMAFSLVKPMLRPYTLSKIVVLGSPEELSSHVHPSQLPSFLGGTYSEFQWPEVDPDAGLTKLEIPARDKREVAIGVSKADSLVSWQFHSSKDIGFEAIFLPDGAGRDELVKASRVESHKAGVAGGFETKGRTGKVILVFDNTYSMMTAKTIMYEVETTTEASS